jgi:hypothetical protein
MAQLVHVYRVRAEQVARSDPRVADRCILKPICICNLEARAFGEGSDSSSLMISAAK